MVSDENKIVKLPVLQYYDQNIKKWVTKKISAIENSSGKNVQVSKIEPIVGGNRVTFTYTLDNGTQENSYLEVMNGEKGVSVVSASVDDNSGELSFTLSNGQTISAGTIAIDSSKLDLKNYYTKDQANDRFVQTIELDDLISKTIEEKFTTATAEDISGLFAE